MIFNNDLENLLMDLHIKNSLQQILLAIFSRYAENFK